MTTTMSNTTIQADVRVGRVGFYADAPEVPDEHLDDYTVSVKSAGRGAWVDIGGTVFESTRRKRC